MSSNWFGLGKGDSDRVRPLPPPPGRNKRLGSQLDFSNSSSGRQLYPTPEDDVMSEVTVDTAILHPIAGSDQSSANHPKTSSRSRSSSRRQLEDALRQIAHLKVEIANRRAKEEEWEWMYSKLQESSRAQEQRIQQLESDRSSLRKHLRQLETKLMKVSIAGVASSPNRMGGASGSSDDDCQSVASSSSRSPSVYTSASIRNRTNFYRASGVGGDDDDDGDDYNNCDGTTTGSTSLGWPTSTTTSSSQHSQQDHHPMGASDLEIEFPRPITMLTLEEEEQVDDDIGDNDRGRMLERMDSVDFGNSATDLSGGVNASPTTANKSITTSTSTTVQEDTLYPEDDPFATMNPLPSGGSVEAGGGGWWRFGTGTGSGR